MSMRQREARRAGVHTAGRPPAEHAVRTWLIAWLGLPVLGIANGAIRERAYADRVGELPAHQLSTATLLVLLGAYMRVLDTRWPLPTTRKALAVGGAWAALTVLFEFGFGHYLAHQSWSRLLRDYNVARGRVWALVPAWTAVGPAAVRTIGARAAGAGPPGR
jgi:hypothetical protein